MAVIGVMGSGKMPWEELASPLGAWIAQNGHDLLTGGGEGVMFSVARAFSQTPGRRGKSLGVVPTRSDARLGFVPLKGYPNPFVELPIITPLPRREDGAAPGTVNRNYVNILTSDVVVALPGSAGTLEEITLALRFQKPLICFGPMDGWASLPEDAAHTDRLETVCSFIASNVLKR
ncbi:MAG: DNA-binding protein [Pseudomonadota bacterium]